MATSTVHVLHGISTPAQFYSQLEDATPQPMVQEILGVAGGYHQPLFRGLRGLAPQVSFRTTQVATLLAEATLLGVDLGSGNTDLFYRKCVDGGTLTDPATTAHIRMRIAKAFMYFRQLSAGHQKEASADATILATYDGTNVPLVPAGTLALSGTPLGTEHFCLGPVSINGTAVDGIEDFTLDMGVELRGRGSNSEPYPTFNGIKSVNPIITLRGAAIEPWLTFGVNGVPLTAMAIYLRKLNADVGAGNMYVLDGTAQHIKFTAAAGIAAVVQTSGEESNTELKLYLRAVSSTTQALTVATASAIT